MAEELDENVAQILEDEMRAVHLREEGPPVPTDEPAPLPPAPSFHAVLLEFVKQLATTGTDLHRLTAPAIMLNGVSLLEYSAHWCDHPDLFSAITKYEHPFDRMVAIVKWFVSSLYGSYASRTQGGGFERKPYNPILGEQFRCNWADGKVTLLAEQGKNKCLSFLVSHHPPVTAFTIADEKAGVHLNGHTGQGTKFTGTAIRVDQIGRVFLWLEPFGEEYAISLPQFHLRGLLTGSPFVELTGETLIVGSNGLATSIRFMPKPWFGGEYNLIEGLIYEPESGQTLFELWGRWTERIMLSPATPGNGHLLHLELGQVDEIGDSEGSAEEGVVILFDAQTAKPQTPTVSTEQGELESRRVWGPVTEALQKGDYSLANECKTRIEDEQRALRKERTNNGVTWLPLHFVWIEDFFLPMRERAPDAESSPETTASSRSNRSLVGIKNFEEVSRPQFPNKELSEASPALSSASNSSERSNPRTTSFRKKIAPSKPPKEDFPGRWISLRFLDHIESQLERSVL